MTCHDWMISLFQMAHEHFCKQMKKNKFNFLRFVSFSVDPNEVPVQFVASILATNDGNLLSMNSLQFFQY